MNLGGLVGGIIVYALGARSSRRLIIWLACFVGIAAISIQIGSRTVGGLYAGRLILGLSNGFFLPGSITYMGEIAPSHFRGSIVGLVTFMTTLGALFGILVDNYTDVYLGRESYQIPLAVMYIVPAFLAIYIIFLPDTPRYYISQGQDEKAAASIRRMRGIHDEDVIRAEVLDIKNSWIAEQELHRGVKWSDMFRGSDLRRTLICFGAAVSGVATGVIYLSGYSIFHASKDWQSIHVGVGVARDCNNRQPLGVPAHAVPPSSDNSHNNFFHLGHLNVGHGYRVYKIPSWFTCCW